MNAVISLSFWAEVHYNSIYPEGGKDLSSTYLKSRAISSMVSETKWNSSAAATETSRVKVWPTQVQTKFSSEDSPTDTSFFMSWRPLYVGL